MRAKRKDMQNALSVLLSLLQVPQIIEHEAVGPVVQKLKNLEQSSDNRYYCVIS